MRHFKMSLKLRGWAFCLKCNASRKHLLGYAVTYDKRTVKAKQCCSCGTITERKPKSIPRDRYD